MTVPSTPTNKYVRCAISLLLIGHLLAVVLPPLSFQTGGPIGQSPAISTIFAAPLEAYSQFLYVDRGYAFFPPDPGPSHLVHVAMTALDGSLVESLIPDLDVHWPRLLYHRHFMMTEFLETIYQPPGPPSDLVEAAPEEAEYWVRTRRRYEHVRQSIIDHLRHEHPGHDVAIRRIEHLIPDVIEYRLYPVALTDPESYRVMLDQPIEEPTVRGELPVQIVPDGSFPVTSPLLASPQVTTDEGIEPATSGQEGAP